MEALILLTAFSFVLFIGGVVSDFITGRGE